MPAATLELTKFRSPLRRVPEPLHYLPLSHAAAAPAAVPAPSRPAAALALAPATLPAQPAARRARMWTDVVGYSAAAVIAGCVAVQLVPWLASPAAAASAAVFVVAATVACAGTVAWRYVATLRSDAARLRGELDAAREAERWHRAVVNDVAQAVLVASPEGRLLETNQAAWALLGRSREELAGRRVWDLLPLDERVVALRRGEGVNTHGGGLRRLLRPDGSVVLADVSWSTLDDGRLIYLARQFK